MPKNPRLIDLTGKRFGQLTVIEQAGNAPRGGAKWLCVCDCGVRTTPAGGDLRLGKVRSCGHDGLKHFRASTQTHGQAKTRLYRIWKAMNARCANAEDPRYGGKGLKVCAEWRDFSAFKAWAETNGYGDNLTIERRDIDEGYSPGNCTWIPAGHQSFNLSIVATAPDGRLWLHKARQSGISDAAYRSRLKDGWSHERAASQPMRVR